MDALVKIVQAIALVVTVTIFFLGLRAWYWQLVAKRSFEVAEQSILVFKRARDAISSIRNPMGWSSEHDQVKIPEGLPEEKRKNFRQYGILFDRANSEQK